MPVELIVHVGAHYAEDRNFYEAIGAKTILWIEADPDTYKILQKTLKTHTPNNTTHLTECALVSSKDYKTLSFYRFDGAGDSSSVHQATETHRERFNVRETGEVLDLPTKTLKAILQSHSLEISNMNNPMLVVDVQGHEMAVLTGAEDEVAKFTFCKCEVSRIEAYQNGAQFPDIDAFFKSQNFKLVSHTYRRVPKHGDVLYKNNLTTS